MGTGCALHKAAEAKGRSHVEFKPEVCWQLPLRREDETSPDGHVTSVVRQWDRRHWGEGGAEFHWWCTEDPEAFVGHEAVYVSMRTELETMAGKAVYRKLAAYLDEANRALAPRSPCCPTRRCGAERLSYSASGSSSTSDWSFGTVPRISS